MAGSHQERTAAWPPCRRRLLTESAQAQFGKLMLVDILVVEWVAGMIVCHPKVSFNKVSGFKVVNPGKQVFVPMAFGEVAVQNAGFMGVADETRHRNDPILCVLSKFLLDLSLKLVNRIQGEMASGVLVVAAAVIRPAEIVPSAIVLHLDMWRVRHSAEASAAFKQARLNIIEGTWEGMRGDDAFNDGLEIKGDKFAIGKAYVRTFWLFVDDDVIARSHVIKICAAKIHNINTARHYSNRFLRHFLSTKLSTRQNVD